MWKRILDVCATLSALLIGAMTVLVSYDIVARNLGMPNLPWVVDATEYALPLATLLVAPWLAYRGGHIKIDLVTLVFPPRVLKVLNRFTTFGCAVLCMVLTWFSISVIIESYETGAVVIKNFVFAEWWVYLPLPLCFALLSIEFLRQVFTGGPQADAVENQEMVG